MRICRFALTVLALSLFVQGCGPAEERRLTTDVRRELAEARSAAESWKQDTATADSNVIALAYLERLRIGLGSPFRLIELAATDPRLSRLMQQEVGWALLASVLDGHAYEVDPVILDRAGAAHIPVLRGIGREHLKQVRETVESAEDVRGGELAVRLGYTIAAAERSVSSEAPMIAARVAALLADARVARDDALRLLQAASDTERDALELLSEWRAERRFAIEQPKFLLPSAEIELDAIGRARGLIDDLRMMAARVATGAVRPAGDAQAVRSSYLPKAAALRLRAISDSLNAPPVTPVIIAARQLTREVGEVPWLDGEERVARAAFGSRVRTEESFVTELSLLERQSVYDSGPSHAAVNAAISLRSYAQEVVWHPGMTGPTIRELRDRYGLAEIEFDPGVPRAWRPYYTRMIVSSLDDLRRVLPAATLRGLRIRFGSAPSNSNVLAMHDPRRRELILPPATAAGTLAHELAHDLDWQLSLRRYGVRGDYASDRAVRLRDGVMATRLLALTPAAMDESRRASAHATRPAEIFARSVDWYVVVSLARQGRVNGYLSSVIDELFTGYGTVRPPDVSGAGGEALIDLISEVTPLYREHRVGFLHAYGRARMPDSYDLVRKVVESLPDAPIAIPVVSEDTDYDPAMLYDSELARAAGVRDSALSAIDRWSCRMPAGLDTRLDRERRGLIQLAANAAVRGTMLRQARVAGGNAARNQLARELFGGPWPRLDNDSLIQEVVRPLATAVRSFEQAVAHTKASSFELLAVEACGPSKISVLQPVTAPVIRVGEPRAARASDARNVRAPDHLVKLDLVSDGKTILQNPLGQLPEIQGVPHR